MNNFKNLNEFNKDFTKPTPRPAPGPSCPTLGCKDKSKEGARGKNETLNPHWVTGFIDGEGSFIIALLSSTGPTKKKVSLRLSVTQKSHSQGVLYELKEFFGCGQVISSSKDCMRYVVQSKKDIITKIIPHFTNYPLQTSKELNFESFKKAATIVSKGDHLSSDGLNEIVNLKNKMNKNRSFEELYNHLLLKKDKVKLDPYWILGFVDAEGTFGSLITKSLTVKQPLAWAEGEGGKSSEKIVTRSRLSISQSTHDVFVLQHIKNFFKAGYLSPKETEIDTLEKAKTCKDSSFYYNSTPETFIPFFDNYTLLTRKLLDFIDFKQFYQFKKEKYYLTEQGFEEMSNLSSKMNSGRDDINKSRKKTIN